MVRECAGEVGVGTLRWAGRLRARSRGGGVPGMWVFGLAGWRVL